MQIDIYALKLTSMISEFQNRLLRIFISPVDRVTPDKIEFWQQTSFSYFAIFHLLFGLATCIFKAFEFVNQGEPMKSVVSFIFLGLTYFVLMSRLLPFRFRKIALFIMNYIVGLSLMIFTGPNGLGHIFITLSFFLLALLIQKKYIPLFIVINALILTAISIIYLAGYLDDLPFALFGKTWWLTYIASIAGSFLATYMLESLVSGLLSHYQKASEGEAHLQGTLGALPSGVIVTNAEGKIHLLNPIARKMCRVLPGEEQNQPLTQILQVLRKGEKDYLSFQELLKDSASRLDTPLVLIPRKGMSIRVRVSLSPITLDDNILGYVSVLQDVTQEYIQGKRQSQIDKLEALGKMAGGIAHDFNNMLTGILGYSELLKRQSESESIQRYTDGIIHSAIRASELTQSLLNYARISPGKAEFHSLNEVIERSVHLVKHSNRNKNAKMILNELPEDCYVKGNFSRLQNSLVNLLMNSCDAMPDGGNISVSCEKNWLSPQYCSDSVYDIAPGPFWKILVEDQGTGIHQNILERIFDPFFTTKGQGKGTGLGLSSVYSTMIDHHGALEVSSKVGVGTCFTLMLPVEHPPAEIDPETSDL